MASINKPHIDRTGKPHISRGMGTRVTLRPRGLPGPEGPVGPAGGSDAATAEWVETGPLTTAALSATYASQISALGGDETARLNAWLANPSPIGVKRLVGSWTISDPLVVPAGTYVDATAAEVTHTVATESAFVLAEGATLQGGTITSPAVFDATTGGVWTYSVIYITGRGVTVDGVTLVNVPRIGIGVKDTDDAVITNCRITGNYPEASWTGVETSHFGIALDPGGSASDGNMVVSGNIIKSCVQGVFVGNFGTGSGRAATIVSNIFEGCWNHGVYATSGDAHTVTGNSFNRCQKPVVVDGSGHVVADNTMWTSTTGGALDKTGIGVRNATDCIVEGNTIVGDNTADNLAISLDNTSGGTELSRNVVRGNIINLAGSASGHAAIRVGNTSATEINRDNRVEGNVIRSSGVTGTGNGLIEFNTKIGFNGHGNVARSNSLIITGNSHGIVLTRQQYAQVVGNEIRTERDAAASETIILVRLIGATDSIIQGNTYVNTSAWGTNVSINGTRENDAACDRNIIGPNVCRWDTTKLASGTEVVQSVSTNASLVAVSVGEYAAATTLGSVTGKVEVRDGKGVIKGYVPVYGTIT